ncbi:MAG: hypothetical protein JW971_04460 [Synergistales bacterium]|nr:hypothetical protein [Synergistales bacterium]
MKSADERDTIFARMTYSRGSQNYRDYYSRNPGKQELDDHLRSMPDICEEGTQVYDPLNSPLAVANFRFLSDIRHLVSGETALPQVPCDAGEMSAKLRSLARYYGADLVGISKLRKDHFYSHRGRPGSEYGKEIHPSHPFAIVIGARMDMKVIDRAPGLPVLVESSLSYVKTAVTGMLLSYYLRELGYSARNHMDGNYLLVANRVAMDAGLGEFGRCGMLVTPDFGPAVRFSVVTTDLPLIADGPSEFGVREFCRICRNCALLCPANALSLGDSAPDWKVDPEKCYEKWRQFGSDCSICISACPLSRGLDHDELEKMKSPEGRKELLSAFRDRFGNRGNSRSPEWI